jgi:hypothetical protein
MDRVTRITPPILPTDVRDKGLWALHLGFEGGNQRIFRVDDDVTGLLVHLKTDGKLQLRSSNS